MLNTQMMSLLKDDTVIIDTREKPRAIERTLKFFDDNGVRHISSKLYCGDYQLLSNGRKVVDRKQSLTEVESNLTQQHERFRAEAVRAQEAGIELVILVEHSRYINSLNDVANSWQNPRLFAYCRRNHISTRGDVKANIAEYVAAGGQKPPISGLQLAKTMYTMSEKYGIRWEFCDKYHTGERILEILTEGMAISDA